MTWLVELQNWTDRHDDEVWKVRAVSKHAARIIAMIARSSMSTNRFDIGTIVPARGGTARERVIAREFRTYCTRTLR